ncbi:nucleoside deaminase [bacterium]|nr:nucleoside deaminase [bacterium]
MDLRQAMQSALELARQAASLDEVPVGAVVVELSTGRIIGRGLNRRESRSDPLGHAEIEALQEASRALQSWRLIDCALVVTLEPCPMCLAAAQQSRVSKLIYSAEDPKGGALSLGYRLHEDVRTHHRFLVERFEVPECSELLTDFFRKKRKKPL